MKLELKVPPMALMIIAIILMKLLAEYSPVYRIDFAGHKMLAAMLLLSGVLVAVSGVMAFKRSQTTMEPRFPGNASRLVITGIYNYSRNPMYLGFLLVLISTAVYLEIISSVLVVALFVAYMNKFQIAPEEKALTILFGEAYLAYLNKVRRWL